MEGKEQHTSVSDGVGDLFDDAPTLVLGLVTLATDGVPSLLSG